MFFLGVFHFSVFEKKNKNEFDAFFERDVFRFRSFLIPMFFESDVSISLGREGFPKFFHGGLDCGGGASVAVAVVVLRSCGQKIGRGRRSSILLKAGQVQVSLHL